MKSHVFNWNLLLATPLTVIFVVLTGTSSVGNDVSHSSRRPGAVIDQIPVVCSQLASCCATNASQAGC